MTSHKYYLTAGDGLDTSYAITWEDIFARDPADLSANTDGTLISDSPNFLGAEGCVWGTSVCKFLAALVRDEIRMQRWSCAGQGRRRWTAWCGRARRFWRSGSGRPRRDSAPTPKASRTGTARGRPRGTRRG